MVGDTPVQDHDTGVTEGTKVKIRSVYLERFLNGTSEEWYEFPEVIEGS